MLGSPQDAEDALQYSAVEVAQILDTTSSAVSSALQRAPKTVAGRVPPLTKWAEQRQSATHDQIASAVPQADRPPDGGRRGGGVRYISPVTNAVSIQSWPA